MTTNTQNDAMRPNRIANGSITHQSDVDALVVRLEKLPYWTFGHGSYVSREEAIAIVRDHFKQGGGNG